MENSKLDDFRNSSDSIADKAVLELIKNDGHKAVYNFIATNRYNAQKIDSQSFPQLAALNNSVHQIPEWLDQKKMELASRLFEKYMPEILHTLGFLSLPYCYAASDGARVLALSKKISENPEKRLRDTATFVLELLSPDAFEQSGKGFASILNTRLIHAATRYSILKSGQWKPGWGMPINQEDQAGTLLSFSYMVLKGLQKMQVNPSTSEQDAYLHFWAVCGLRLGIMPELIFLGKDENKALEMAIRQRHFRESEHGQFLTKVLLDYYRSQTPSIYPAQWAESQMANLLGPQVAEYLGITKDDQALKAVPKGLFPLIMKLQMGSNTKSAKIKMAERK
jgi:hypothetical protein